ncbi:MAG: hypothetical protein WDN72_03675 [Alphaproteobacteria bacterium]
MAKIIAFTYDRAIDRRVLLECDTLRRAGHDVTIVAPDFGGIDAVPGIRRIPVPQGSAGRVFRFRYALEKRWPTAIARLRPLLRLLAWFALRADPRRVLPRAVRARARYAGGHYHRARPADASRRL